MAILDERERAFELKFAQDQGTRFQVHALRNLLLGRWVAERLRLRPAEAESYATALAQSDVGLFGDDEIVNRVMSDFRVNDEPVTDAEIRAELGRLLPIAKRRIANASI